MLDPCWARLLCGSPMYSRRSRSKKPGSTASHLPYANCTDRNSGRLAMRKERMYARNAMYIPLARELQLFRGCSWVRSPNRRETSLSLPTSDPVTVVNTS